MPFWELELRTALSSAFSTAVLLSKAPSVTPKLILSYPVGHAGSSEGPLSAYAPTFWASISYCRLLPWGSQAFFKAADGDLLTHGGRTLGFSMFWERGYSLQSLTLTGVYVIASPGHYSLPLILRRQL